MTVPAIGTVTGDPAGAAMSMPECGLRDSPLKMRRMPNDELRGPGTGCGRCRDSGGGSEKELESCSVRTRSPATLARSALDKLTWRGGTLSDCLAYSL